MPDARSYPQRPYLAVSAALLGLASLTSCVVPLVAGGAATTGYVAGQERGVSTQFSDASLKASINDRWARYSGDMQRQLSLSVRPPKTIRPSVLPSRTAASYFFTAAALMSGPRKVSRAVGSPIFSARVFPTSWSRNGL